MLWEMLHIQVTTLQNVRINREIFSLDIFDYLMKYIF